MLIEQQVHLIDRNAQLNDRNAQLAERDALIAAHERTIPRKTSQIDYKTATIAKLTAEIARLKRLQFSAHSGQFNREQRALFEETMAADIAAVEAQLEALRDPPPMNTPRSPAVRRPLPPELDKHIGELLPYRWRPEASR